MAHSQVWEPLGYPRDDEHIVKTTHLVKSYVGGNYGSMDIIQDFAREHELSYLTFLNLSLLLCAVGVKIISISEIQRMQTSLFGLSPEYIHTRQR